MKRTGRRPATFLQIHEQPEAGQWLEETVAMRPTKLLTLLVQRGVPTTSHRLRRYFSGRALPEPPTLRAICEVAGVSYVEAIDRFGYYREIVRLFDDLAWLGGEWLREDNARGGTLTDLDTEATPLQSLRDTGVIFWNNVPITWGGPIPGTSEPGIDPYQTPSFIERYFIGTWCELQHQNVQVAFDPIEATPGESFSLTIPGRLEDAPQSLPRESLIVPQRDVSVIVPKPIAVAVLLATLSFPMRGDAYKAEASTYRFDLGKAAGRIGSTARSMRENIKLAGRPKHLHPLLQRAIDALDDRSIPFNYRRPIAAEYVVMWADSICRDFTHYARLAAYEFWGEAGGHGWTTVDILQYSPFGGPPTGVRAPRPSPFTMMPQAKEADLPEIDSLTTFA